LIVVDFTHGDPWVTIAMAELGIALVVGIRLSGHTPSEGH
jgi:hypothetical protein